MKRGFKDAPAPSTGNSTKPKVSLQPSFPGPFSGATMRTHPVAYGSLQIGKDLTVKPGHVAIDPTFFAKKDSGCNI